MHTKEREPYQFTPSETAVADAVKEKFGTGSMEHNETLCVIGGSFLRFYNTKPSHLDILKKIFLHHGVRFPN